MDIGAEASQLHLLALASFDCQRVCVDPFISGHLGRLGRVSEDVEHSWLVDDWQEGHAGHDLLEDRSNFCLNLLLRFGRNRIPSNGSRNERPIRNSGTGCSLGVRSFVPLSLDKVDVKDPSFERRTGILRNNGEDELSDGSGEQPFWDTSDLFIIRNTWR